MNNLVRNILHEIENLAARQPFQVRSEKTLDFVVFFGNRERVLRINLNVARSNVLITTINIAKKN